jgi:hypothetical protein
MEAEERLEQLDFLIQQITQLEKTASDYLRRSMETHDQNVARNLQDKSRFFSSPEMAESRHFSDLHKDLVFQIKLFAEAFYYFAARRRTVLRHFPHLKSLDAPGVRNVRNHLIEHPDKSSSGVTQQNWGFGGQGGPTLKNARRPGQEHVPIDRGLFINAAELRDNIESKLRAALKSLPSVT